MVVVDMRGITAMSMATSAVLGSVAECVLRRSPCPSPFLWAAIALVTGLQLLAIYLTPLASVLQIVQPAATDWIVVAISIIAPVIIVETAKMFARRINNRYRRK